MKLPFLFDKRLKSARDGGRIATECLVDMLTSLAITSRRKSVDAFVLCELCSKIGYTIQTEEAPDLPQEVTAIAVKLKDRYLILYHPSISVISVQISVLHELCHILLKHCSLTLQEIEDSASFYTDEQEAEAERLASILLVKLSEITPKETWWENILKGHISLSSPPPPIQRWMELMQNASPILKDRGREAKNSVSSFRIARIKQLFS